MSDKIIHLEKQSLKRVLGVPELFSIGYADVGSSIYYALGITALFALGATPIAFAIAGAVFICTALTYAEMSSTFPEPGGSATFTRYAFNDMASFIAGWGLLLDYIVTIAISAFAVPGYLVYFIPYSSSAPVQIGITVALIALLYVLNVIGIKESGRFSLILAGLTLLSQAVVVLIAALFLLNLPYVISHLKINVPGADWSPNWWEFMKGTAMAMVAYTGIESITQLAAETKKPAVSIPRAIKWTIGILILMYFSISMVGLSAVSPQDLGTKYINDPIAGIIMQLPIGGKLLAPWIGLIAAIILLIAANAGLIGCSRLIFSMGEYYQVPHVFYKMHERFRTPHISLAVFSALAAFIVILSRGRMLFLADLYNFGAQIAFFSCHLSLLTLRIRKPKLNRPYRAPFNIPIGKGRSWPLTAIIGLFATFATWLLVVITKPEGRNLGAVWILLGLVMYFFYRKKKQIAVTGHLSIEKVKIPDYAQMKLRHILVTARALGNTEAIQTACELAKSFDAQITAVHVLEIAPSLPMHVSMLKAEEQGEIALKRAEAIAREYDLTMDLKLVRARTLHGALLDLLKQGSFDMLVIGARKEEFESHSQFAAEAKNLFREAPCRVLFCKS